MNHKHMLFGILCTAMIGAIGCNSSGSKPNQATETGTSSENTTGNNGGSNPKGIGKYTNIQLTHPLDEKMVAKGQDIYNVKCSSCHKLTNEKLVGPGWKGVTDRRTPEWIMNFVTNTDEMIEKDTAAQNLLEVCLVKMPNQNLSEEDARAILEFQRKNDGKK